MPMPPYIRKAYNCFRVCQIPPIDWEMFLEEIELDVV